MSAEAVGPQMPTQITLNDLAVMAAADENHRYELSPEGVLSVAPPADPDHALLVSRVLAWFLTNGYGPAAPSANMNPTRRSAADHLAADHLS